jgi:inner membrane transporter RhtA
VISPRVRVGVALPFALAPAGWSLRRCAASRLRVFGIWMSLGPAVAALARLVLLAEVLGPRQRPAVGWVVAACTGTARTARDGTGRGPAGVSESPA